MRDWKIGERPQPTFKFFLIQTPFWRMIAISTSVCPREFGEKDFGHLTSDFETATPSPSTSTLKSEVRSLKSKMRPHDRTQVSFSAFILSFIFVCCQARRRRATAEDGPISPFNPNKRKSREKISRKNLFFNRRFDARDAGKATCLSRRLR